MLLTLAMDYIKNLGQGVRRAYTSYYWILTGTVAATLLVFDHCFAGSCHFVHDIGKLSTSCSSIGKQESSAQNWSRQALVHERQKEKRKSI